MSAVVFFDHAAGSPLRSEVALAMDEAVRDLPPNPSGAHRLARATRAVLDEARERIAASVGVPASGVVLSASGTEANNLGILGCPSPRAVCISTIEHVAVREAATLVARRAGVELIELRVDDQGVLDLDAAIESIPDGALVAVMAANSETGAIQPLAALSGLLRDQRTSTNLHSDAVAAAPAGTLAAAVAAAGTTAIAAQKLGGPAGVAALFVADGQRLDAQLLGGGQELGRRSGTENVRGAVGLAAALSAVDDELRSGAIASLLVRRDSLERCIIDELDGIRIVSKATSRLPGHSLLLVEGCRSEELLILLDQAGICASAGSACASGAPQASRVLLAMGIDEMSARSALRLSLSTSSSDNDVDRCLSALCDAVRRLRA